MLVDAIELLDRQVAFLLKQKERNFFMQLPSFVEALWSDPRISGVAEDLRRDAMHKLSGINLRRTAVRDALLEARDQLVSCFPETNDCDVSPAIPGDPGWRTYSGSLAQFAHLASGHSARWPNLRDIDTERDPLAEMVSLLDAKIHGVDPECQNTAAQPLRLASGNASRRLEQVRRDYDLATMTSASVSAVRVLESASELSPEPLVFSGPRELRELMSHTMEEIYGVGGMIRSFVFDRSSTRENATAIARIETALRQDVERFHEEARRRLGSCRSLRAIVDRYKMRAEWHDAATLRELAEKHPGRVEVTLTANFARYLHDQGLNPLTKLRAGGLEPDILAPFADPAIRWTFYAEAKQYDSACVPYLRRGIREVADHLTRLRGTAFEVREGFYMVFRLGGPLYHFPGSLRLGEVTLYPLLVDVADPKRIGSRAKESPVVLSEEELLPSGDEGGAESV